MIDAIDNRRAFSGSGIAIADDTVISQGVAPDRTQTQLEFNEFAGPAGEAELACLLESLLLVAPGPTTLEELANGAGVTTEAADAALANLETRVTTGWVVQRHGDKIQLATAPRFATHVRRFLGLDRETRLSGASLESLAIIAYQQPVTKADVESVRGVDCSGVLQTLLQRGLIEQTGRVAAPGNPIQYGTTPEFLLHFGLRSLADLPPLGQVQGQDVRGTMDAIIAAGEIENGSSMEPGT